jgi:hypothetical protein
MKAKTTYNAKATLFLVVFATLISVVGADGQTSAFSGKFVLPYQVRWSQAVLRTGAYSINFPSIHSPAIVRSMNGKTSAFVFTSKTGDSEKGPSSLTIVTRGLSVANPYVQELEKFGGSRGSFTIANGS